MKIVYLAPVINHTIRWAKWFADKGHEVHIVTTGKTEEVKGIEVHQLKSLVNTKIRIANLAINTLPLIAKYRELITKINPEVVHLHSVMDLGLLEMIKGNHGFVVTVWGSDVLVAPQKSFMSKFMVKSILRQADMVTCDADHVCSPLAELGVNPEKIKVVYFGVDTEYYKPANVKPFDISQPVVLSLRSLEPIYDVETLIRSVPLVLQYIPNAMFVVAGNGTQENALKKLAEDLGVANNIKFVGRLDEQEVRMYLQSADVYVSTSLSDAGLSACTAEAMACGLPVVVTDYGDNCKWVEHGLDGITFQLKDYETLAKRIVWLLQKPTTCKEFGVKARAKIAQQNNVDIEMGKIEKLYESLAHIHSQE